MTKQICLRTIPLLLVSVASICSYAANTEYQNFFAGACLNPTGQLAVRCAETPSGGGNLSGDSESSLNPSQVLSTADLAYSNARSKNEKNNELIKSQQTADEGVKVDLGPFSLLLNGYSLQEEQSRDIDIDAERGYDLDASGVEVGVDYRASDTFVVGGLVAWENSKIEFVGENSGVNFTPLANSAGKMDQDSVTLTVFASLELGESGYLSAAAGYSKLEMDVTRNSVFQESTRSLDQVNVRVAADMQGSATWVALNWGYVAEFGSWTLSPRVGVLSSRSAVDAYTEEDVNNSGLAMSVNQVERNSLLGQLSLGLSGSWSTESALFIPQMRIDFEHEFDTDAPATSARFLLDSGNTQYLLSAQERESDTLNVGVGMLVILPNGWMPFVDYQILLGNSQRDSYRITAGLRKEI